MKQVLVFKTSIANAQDIVAIEPLLKNLLDKTERWNFDLDDCDRILRVEAEFVKPISIIEQFERVGVMCTELK